MRYFLGANSEDGFASLYGGFAAAGDDRLHIIKGGPGTGKSGFMKRIGAAAEKAGLDVEYVLCSGDPDSLDGVYIPELRQAWVDGTAPHVGEPRCFGADADYVNLGQFCRLPLKPADRQEVFRLEGEEYKRPKGTPGPGLDEWYNRKWLNLCCTQPFGEALYDAALPEQLADEFAALMPLYSYFMQFYIPEQEGRERR